MSFFRTLLLLAVFGLFVGCGPAESVNIEPVQVTPVDTVKATLQDVANSGELGSGFDDFEQQIEALRATDAAKGDALAAGYEKLKACRTPDEIKRQAAAMLEGL